MEADLLRINEGNVGMIKALANLQDGFDNPQKPGMAAQENPYPINPVGGGLIGHLSCV